MSVKCILFTDVANSTGLKSAEFFGRDRRERDQRYLGAVQEPYYDRVAQRVHARNGRVVNTLGDAFYVVFDSPIDSLRAVAELFRSLRDDPIPTISGQHLELYGGLHYGEVEDVDRSKLHLSLDHQGTEVDKASRVQHCASRGQILLSDSMHQVLGTVTDIRIRLVGTFFLRGLGDARLWDVDWDGCGTARRPRISPVSIDLDLPPNPAGFVGRELESDELRNRLRVHATICVQGISGLGKTSLVVKYALGELKNLSLCDHGFLYFDCAARDMRGPSAPGLLLEHFARFFSRTGVGDEIVATVASDKRNLPDRVNAVVSGLQTVPCLLFLDNFQEALGPDLKIKSDILSELLTSITQRDIRDSRLVLATFERWSPPDRCPIFHYDLPQLSAADTVRLMNAIGLVDPALISRCRELVGGHPQALQWFARLAEDESIAIGDVIDQLASLKRNQFTEAQFHKRLGDELFGRVYARLTVDARRLLDGIAVFRQPPTFDAFRSAADFQKEDVTAIRTARKELLAYFLVKAEALEGAHTIDPLAREFALFSLKQNAETYRARHGAAADWWNAAGSVFGEVAAGIERHYHLAEALRLEEASELQAALVERLNDLGEEAWKRGLLDEALKMDHWDLEHGNDAARAHFHLAQTYKALNRPPEAEHHYREALAIRIESRFVTGFANFLGGQRRDLEADDMFLDGVRRCPDPVLYGYYSRFLLARNRVHEAEAQYRAALRLEPDNPRLLSGLVALLFRRDALKEAEPLLTAALARSPENPIYHTQLGQLYSRMPGRAADARHHFETGLKLAPQDAASHNEFARWLATQKRDADAESHFQTAVKLSPQKPHARMSYGMFLVSLARYTEAEEQLRAGLAANPNSLEFTTELGRLYSRMPEREADARHHFETGLELAPQDAVLHNEFARWLVTQKRDADAESHFQTAVTLAPQKPHARMSYGMFLANLGRYAEAEEQLRAGLAANPDSREITSALAGVLGKAGHTDKAIKTFEDGVTRFPDSYSLLNQYGDFLRKLQKWDSAEVYLRKAVAISPDEPQAVLLLGVIVQRHNVEKAEAILRGGLKDRRTHVPIFSALGQLLASKGEFVEAQSLFMKAFELDPRNLRIRSEYAYHVLLPTNRLVEAHEVVSAGLAIDPTNSRLLRTQEALTAAEWKSRPSGH